MKIMKKNDTTMLAKERLSTILMADALNYSNEEIYHLEQEIKHCVNKYFQVRSSQIKTRLIQKPDECNGKRAFVLVVEATIME